MNEEEGKTVCICFTGSHLNRVDPRYRYNAGAALPGSMRIVTALMWRNPESRISVTNVSFPTLIAPV